MNLENKIEKSYPLIKNVGNEIQRTLYFSIPKLKIVPGQFYMLNYNGRQKPFSVSHYKEGLIGFTIQDRGECSKKMLDSVEGDYFGLTGPLGKGFNSKKSEKTLLIGAGIGSAPINFLLSDIYDSGKNADVLFGGRSFSHIEYLTSLKDNERVKIRFYTDDGSYGDKGFIIKDLDLLLENNYDSCFICGPEKMMGVTLDKIKDKIPDIQISMERYMKCGVGLCGSCAIDDIGLRVCEDGPVFSYKKEISKTREFANYHRDGLGVIIGGQT
ncbi:MAG TPA: hypothetical protein PLO89_06485 [Spirochaetota bacterium]|nr:hypothetical protein [Spirochaetota bacterium]